MKLVGINVLKHGEKLAYSIYSSSGKAILNTGAIISESYIEKLKRIGIYSVYIDDDKFDDIKVVEAINHKTRSNSSQVFKQTYEQFHKEKTFDEYAIVEVVKQIVDDIKSSNSMSINILPSIVMDDYLTGHSVNVCILSIILGNNIKYNFSQLTDLGVGAFIHDIARNNGEVETLEHVQKGFETMKKYRGISLHSSKVIYEHHEKFNGFGYPRKIKGEAISEFSRIISVADFYESLILVRGNRSPLLPHEAYEALLAESNKSFDPNIIDSFRNSVSIYPNGSSVRLSNGKKGVVVSQNRGTPQRPVIRIVEGSNVIEDMDLIKNLTLFVEAVIDE